MKKLWKQLGLMTLLPTLLCGSVKAEQSSETRQPILVELFTSEGCSSCPPADRLAVQLQDSRSNGHEIIILSEHVDYWNHLGWKDPFSSAQFSERQQRYVKVLQQDSVYTPEAVMDGARGVVGSEAGLVNDAIVRSDANPKAALKLTSQFAKADSLKVGVAISSPANLNGKRAQLIVAIAENALSSKVSAGENEGEAITHTGVVRYMKLLNEVTLDSKKESSFSSDIPITADWKRQNLRLVAFLQEPSTLKILGASRIKI